MFSRICVAVVPSVALILIIAAAQPSADEAIDIDVTPAFCLAPCMVTVSVFLEPHEMHRELMVEADSVGFYRSSFVDLDGEKEPIQHHVVWKSVPEGFYEVRATVKRADGHRSQASAQVRVAGQ